MNTQKKLLQTIKFNLAVGEAKPGPVLAPILGQSQINIQAFCKEFVELTQNLQEGVRVRVKVNKYIDKSFKVKIEMPALNYLYEQIVLSRSPDKSGDFGSITKYEILDILFIQKKYIILESLPLQSDLFLLKLILSFLQSKKVNII